jgi:Zn-dependent protease
LFDIASIISRAIVLLVAVVVHEFAHGYVALTQGDTTAYDQGRVTLDPRANVWWQGYIIGVLFGFAILGSAPVVPQRMRNPRLGMLLAVGAGPVSNLLLASLFAIPFRFGLVDLNFEPSIGGFLPTPERVLYDMVLYNALLFVFNLLPLSPLDGWTVLLSLLPTGPAIWWQRNRQNSMYVLFGLIFFSFAAAYLGGIFEVINPMNWLLYEPTFFIMRLLIGGA